MDERDRYGLGLRSGSDHYRAYVGPPKDYDLIAALTVGLLFAAGWSRRASSGNSGGTSSS